MAKYNLYRVWPQKRFELTEKLRKDGLELAKKIEKDGCVLEFFYSRQPKASDIWWTKTYRDFFEGIEPPKNVVYSAALLVYNDDFCYAAALGKTYFAIKNYCDADFGVNLAQRIADGRVKSKNSKFFKSRRNRAALSYQGLSRLEFDSGESLDFLRAATIDPGVWGAAVNFGAAAQFSLELAPDQLPVFAKKIEAVLAGPAKIELPKVMALRDPGQIKDLDVLLAQALLAQTQDENLFLTAADDCQYSLYLQGEYGDLSAKSGLDFEALKNFFTARTINLAEQINDIKVRVFRADGHERSKSLKTLIDFRDDEQRSGLIDGKWHRYNKSFLNFLRAEADSIPVERNRQKINAAGADEFIKEAVDLGFADCRKAIASIDEKFKVNKCDLYKESTLYFVKIGAPETIDHAANQAINMANFLRANHGRLAAGEQEFDVDKICLWLALSAGREIAKLSQIDSLNFLMKIADFKRSVSAAGFRPRVRISG